MTPFSDLMNRVEEKSGEFAVTIPEDWMNGRTTYGGLAAALCLKGALLAAPGHAPLRTAQIAFVGPAGGDVMIKPTVLRQGKSVAFVGADLVGEAGLAARAVFGFGAGRESQLSRHFSPPPDLPAADSCEPFMPPGAGPSFTNHYETRLAKGARPATSSSEHDHYLWVRHRDRQASDIVALMALADMPPPAVMPMFTHFKPISTMTWMLNFMAVDAPPADEWLLLQSRAEYAVDGYSSQDMVVWRGGEPIIAGKQNVAIFV